MKKTRWLSVILVIALVMTASVFAVGASETDHSDCECRGADTAAHTYVQVTEWTELGKAGETTSVANTSLISGGNFILAGDITIGTAQATMNKNTTIRIDLNGNTLYHQARLFNATAAGITVVITDSVGGGKIELVAEKKHAGGAVALGTNSVARMYAGTIDGSGYTWTPDETNGKGIYGAVVSLQKDTSAFDMYGGTIIGGTEASHTQTGTGACVGVGAGTFTMHNGTITGGTSEETDGNGGAVYNAGNFTMKAGTITGGTVPGQGGAIYNYGGTFTMDGGTITGGNSSKYGGTIRNSNSAIFTMNNGTINGGTAASGGGAIRNDSGATFNMVNGTINGGTENSYGGGAIYNAGSFTMGNGSITGGTAASYGGAIYNVGTFDLNGGSITGGTATNGGAVYNDNDACTFTMKAGTSITAAVLENEESVATDGGAVYNKKGTFTMDGGTITGGKVSGNGGAVHNTSTFKMNNGAITGGNSAKYGGTIRNEGTFTMAAGTITGGTAESGGGAVNNRSSFTVTGGTITGGTATGGAFHNGAGTITIENATLNAGDHGSGRIVYVNAGSVSLKDCTLNNSYNDGTSLWTKGTITMVGNINMSGDNLDLMLDGDGTLNVTDLTSTNDTITVRRWADQTDEVDDPGVVATGATADHEAMFQAWKADFCIVYENDQLVLKESVAQVGEKGYATVAKAVTAAGGTNVVKLLADADEITAEGALYLDLNGYDVAGTVTATTLYGIDTATRLYGEPVDGATTYKYGTIANISGTVQPFHKADGRRYLAITDEDGTHFHRYYMTVTAVSIAPGNSAFTYKVSFLGDSKIKEVADAGTIEYGMYFKADEEVHAKATSAFNAGPYSDKETLDHNYLRYGIQGVLSDEEGADNNSRVSKPVYAKAYIKVGESYDYSAEITRSFNDVLKSANEAYPTLENANLKAALVKMVKDYYTDSMTSWTDEVIGNIKVDVA